MSTSASNITKPERERREVQYQQKLNKIMSWSEFERRAKQSHREFFAIRGIKPSALTNNDLFQS